MGYREVELTDFRWGIVTLDTLALVRLNDTKHVFRCHSRRRALLRAAIRRFERRLNIVSFLFLNLDSSSLLWMLALDFDVWRELVGDIG